ncbi:MAG: 50S ribosomal protein L30e [Candidatus Micrarchaeia archaeon]
MADLATNIRLAVDTGKVVIGARGVTESIKNGEAKLVIISSVNNEKTKMDILHDTTLAGIKVEEYTGNSMDLGTVCGKPYSVSALAIIDQGNSSILDDINK